MFPQHTKSKYQQDSSSEATHEPALQTMADDQAKTKTANAAAMQMRFPAHKNTPINNLYARKRKKEPSENSEGSET